MLERDPLYHTRSFACNLILNGYKLLSCLFELPPKQHQLAEEGSVEHKDQNDPANDGAFVRIEEGLVLATQLQEFDCDVVNWLRHDEHAAVEGDVGESLPH